MSESISSEQRVTQPEVAAFLVHRTRVAHLHPFMGRDCSLSEAAAHLGIGKSRMGYWLKKLLEIGLVRLVRVEKRGRHEVPVYRAVADVFTKPIELVEMDADENLMAAHASEFEEAAKRSLLDTARMSADYWDVRFRFADGAGRLEAVPRNPSLETIVNHWGKLRFSPQQAMAFRRELLDLIERFVTEASSEGRFYLYKLMMVEESLE